MNKNIIVFVVILVGLFGLLLFGQGRAKTASLPVDEQIQKGSELITENGFYDFGIIPMDGGNVTTSYVVSNNTGADIRVDSLVTSCMCTTAYLVNENGKKGPFGMPGHGDTVPRANEVIKSGEKWTIEVVFDPAAHGPAGAGKVERSVYLVDERGGALELQFIAEVTI